MSVKKAIMFLTAVSLIFGSVVIPEAALASYGSSPVIYDFESDMSPWEMGETSKAAELERLEEENNGFLRLTAKSGEAYRLQDNIDVVPNGYVQLDRPYIMAPNAEIVISAAVRTNETKLIRNFMLNRDRLQGEAAKEIQYNFATLWNWDKSNKISTYELTQTSGVGGYKKAKSNTAFTGLENDKWYTFCTILYTDSDGIPEGIKLKVTDGDAVSMETERREIAGETLKLSNEITRLDFDLGNASVTLSEDATFDIDDVRIYQNTDERFCSIKASNEGHVFTGGDPIVLAFNAPMDGSTVNPDNIKLYDASNEPVEYDGAYDENRWEYTVTPKTALADGSYLFHLSSAELCGLRSDGSVISGILPGEEADLRFVIFGGALPEVRDLSISCKNLEGETITASGEFYQEDGLPGHLIYEWQSSESESDGYTRIEGENGDSFLVPYGFMNRYIRLSVIPMTDDGIIRGEEAVSNVIAPPAKPTAQNVALSGELISGESLRAWGEYSQEDGLSGYLRYAWWSAGSQNGAYAEIEGATDRSLTVTDELADKYIKISATPVTDDGLLVGETVWSTPLSPLSKPYAESVSLSGLPVCGMTLSLGYTFGDENGDREAESLYEWYVSPDGTGGWTKIDGANARDYVISDEDLGKYFKARVTPVADREPSVGNAVDSNRLGPVGSMESLNLVSNPGFEEGKNTGWSVHNMGGDAATVTATGEDAYSGDWCGRFEGQTVNSTYMVYGVNLDAGTRYIVSCMMKVAPDSTKDNVAMAFYGEGNPERSYKYSEQNVIKKADWSRVSQLISLKSSGRFSEMPQHWPNGTPGYIAYIDDFYFAPLLVADIEAKVPESIDIPTSGTVKTAIPILALWNQLGTSLGLEEETAHWEVDAEGVYAEDEILYVTSNARSGVIRLRAVCEPQFDGAIQPKFVKEYPVALLANDNKTPRILSASLTGDTTHPTTLALDYDFYQIDNASDESVIRWYASDTENGSYTDTGETGMTFEVTTEYLDRYIKAKITPVDGEGREGKAVFSNAVGPKVPPVAQNVTVTGKGFIGGILKSEYTYEDFNGDPEGNTVFRWLRSPSKAGN